MNAPQTHHLDRRAETLAAVGAGNPDDLLDTHALAEWLGVSAQWCETARRHGIGPRFLKITPRRIRYRRDDVLAWLKARTVATRG